MQLKTGFDLARSLREILKRPELDPGEVQSRTKELYDYFLEAQESLPAANEEIGKLRRIIADHNRIAEIEADLEMQ